MQTNAETATLARFVVESRWNDLPPEVHHETKRGLLNFIGAAFGGARDAAIDHAATVLGRFSGRPEAGIIGRPERYDALTASFLNAASGNVLDFDDTHHPTVIHPTSPVAPPLIALGETGHMSGADFLHALALGIEIACRIGNSVSPFHYARGWHITSTCGAVGAAAASGKVLGLDTQRMVCALGLGANQACGLVESLGSMAKSVSVGNAARNGLFAALLAQQGYTAAPGTLEGPRGFAQVMGDRPNLKAMTRNLGARWEVCNNMLKPYPSGVVLHSVTDACLELRARHHPPIERIAGIRVYGHPLLRQRADRPAPGSGREAAVSAQHSVAVCFIHGAAGVAQYSDASCREPAVLALGAKVSVEEDPRIAVAGARVTLTLNDGQTYSIEIEHALGSLQRPMSDADVEAKVRTLVAGHDCPVDRLIEAVWQLDRCEDVSALTLC